MGKWWILQLLPSRDFLSVETSIIMVLSGQYAVVLWIVGLYNNLTRRLASACPSSYLSEEVKSPLPGAEIGQIQGNVRRNDAHQRNVGKIQSFGYHLRAYENIDLAVLECVQNSPMSASAGGGVGVHPVYSRFRKGFPRLFLDLLGSGPEVAYISAVADGA